MRVDGDGVTIAPQRTEESQPLKLAALDEIFLVDAVQMRIVLQQILRAGPHHERVNRRAWKVRAQFADERRGDQGVADAGHGDEENFHSREIFSSNLVVDLTGTNRT